MKKHLLAGVMTIGWLAILISWQPVTASSLPFSGNTTGHAWLVTIPFSPSDPDDPPETTTPAPDSPTERLRGYTGLSNPATGNYITGTEEDPLADFTRRPLDKYIIPAGGLFMDPLHDGPHYGVDYSSPDDYLNNQPSWVHPIGPGYVTARSSCLVCFADGNPHGQVITKAPKYNFGFGGLVVLETPYSTDVSIYTLYAHLDRDFLSLGDYVTPDDIIGVAGNTGYSEEIHVHLEVRYGEPGRFWNADFSEWATLDRWMATMFVTPAVLVFPEYHASFVAQLDEWVARQNTATESP